MAISSINGYNFFLQFGNGDTPTEAFAVKCMFNAEKGFEAQADVIKNTIPNCDTPSAPGWTETEIDGLGMVATGSGMMDTADEKYFFNWWKSGLAKNMRIVTNVLLASGGGYYYGAFKLAAFQITSPSEFQKLTFNATFNSHGAVAWTDAAS